MATDMPYEEYALLAQTDDIRSKFNNHQWVCLNKMVSGKQLSSSDLRVLKGSGLVDQQGEPTLIGRVCIAKINKKRHKTKKVKTTRKKERWETQNLT